MKKLFLSMMLLALPIFASAYDCYVDGIYYRLIKNYKTAGVTYQMYDNGYKSDYSGSVTIPEKFTYEGVEYTVTFIEENAFYGCSSLTSVTIPNSVTTIGSNAFYLCTSLTSVTIPNSVTTIEIGAYYGCSGLTSVTIPNSVNSIRDSAFSNCSSLTSVTIPNSVNSIGYRAFDGCSGLTSVTIPNSVSVIEYGAFLNCDNLTSVYITDLEAWCKIAFSSDSSNPLTYAHHFYLNGEEIRKLVIPNTVNSITKYAFIGYKELVSVVIPNSVTSIGEYAFYNCRGLTSVTIPNSVTTIEDGAFYDCTGLISVTIPSSVTSIRSSAFYNCTGLISVHITDLAAWCNIDFSEWTSNPLSYAHHLYIGNTELLDVVIPEGVTAIKQYAFYGGSYLTSADIPNSVTTIEKYAFRNCNGLTSVTIPNSVTSIGDYAFQECSALASVTIPNSVTSIGEYAFYDCYSMKTLTLPEDMTIIKKSTFQYCRNLTEVVIPAKVEFIYADAFSGCGLKSVTSQAVNPPFCHDLAFSNYNIPLYVPAEAVNCYQATNPWSKFSELKTISGDPIDNKCTTPTISYADKKLTFSCETEGVEFVSKITDADIKDHNGSEISLSATYEISVYATKSGYTNSDVATATLVWTDAIFTETTPETPTSAKAVQESIPVLISAKGGNISVRCEADGQEVNVYTIDGLSLGTATVKNGEALISTSIPSGDIAVVKVGGRSVKVLMR